MVKFISWIIFLIVALVIAMLSVANREIVTFSLDPLPFLFDLPLYILLLAAGFLGLVIGALSVWLRKTSAAMESRALRRDVAALKSRESALMRELEEERAKSAMMTAGPAAAAPTERQLEHHAHTG
ncbi:lipopolysaccharide assembly protein LapA domain-containing protein [Sneathiella sp.]|mgnify:CR=1 FL=1|uniref:lipopolysaccharide assembly protein LapA domain-containing protein n=1 Tax=Sneathiella sp. TaxID=1964365 RepID=UPI002FE41F05